jgi:N-acetylglutamate synthase-like GNAT family acetyltransferase
MSVTTRVATPSDLSILGELDSHLPSPALAEVVAAGRVLVVVDADGAVVGCLRWGMFWDEVPFMNLLWLLPDCRGRGLGTTLVRAWETASSKPVITWS